ncbi:MAG: hypothetical protein CM15mP42_10480 [Methanobacteriota archaeon]|nr:MAG: hypothetical protein CM15mP42_10480 [Euryarchaeota archaeon]
MSHPNFLAKSSIEDIALSEKSLPSTTTSAGEPGPGSGCSFLTTKAWDDSYSKIRSTSEPVNNLENMI